MHTVARWHHAEWGHLRPGETLKDRIARVQRDCGHCQIPTTFIATAGPQPLGSASLTEHDMATRPELSPWLSDVFVAREHRRRGIGAALVERVVQEAWALGILRLLFTDVRSNDAVIRVSDSNTTNFEPVFETTVT
jgi:GNAT superfamily N-acetyltransferase